MNEIDFLLLKAQLESLRTWAIVRDGENLNLQQKWKSRYILWELEQESLQEQEKTLLSSLDTSRVCQRVYELQILLDVAHIRGNLEEYDIVRYIDPIIFEKAMDVAPDEYYEQTILEKIASLL